MLLVFVLATISYWTVIYTLYPRRYLLHPIIITAFLLFVTVMDTSALWVASIAQLGLLIGESLIYKAEKLRARKLALSLREIYDNSGESQS